MSQGLFINGQWIVGAGAAMESTDPATGNPIWTGNSASPEQIDLAITAARDASRDWARRKIEDRAGFLLRFVETVRMHRADFAEAICLDSGKPRWESATEVDSVINKAEATIQANAERCAEKTQPIAGATATTRYRAHGVVAVLGPFNFPAHLPNGHIMPALLAGNTVVFKPSELTPFVAERMVELWRESGLPAGVLNLVQGAREVGEAAVAHPGIDGVFFTGSYDAGRSINRALADHPEKIIALEMGGNNPLFVHNVSDIDAAVYWTIQSAFITAGQRCSCARRLIVIDSADTEHYLEKLVESITRIQPGPYTNDPEPFIGPVISESAAERLRTAWLNLVKSGGREMVQLRCVGPTKAMLSPGLIDVTHVADRPDIEHFGPLLQLIRVKDIDAAIAEANRTRFGLSAGLFSDDANLWERFASEVRAGVINWNRPLAGASALLPFGGIGCSGNHRPSAYFAADYCSQPVASMQSPKLQFPSNPHPELR